MIRIKMRLLYHIVHRRSINILGGGKEISKSKKVAPRNKVALELLYHILGHRSMRYLIAVDAANVWKDIELRIYP